MAHGVHNSLQKAMLPSVRSARRSIPGAIVQLLGSDVQCRDTEHRRVWTAIRFRELRALPWNRALLSKD
jgi:hypothetical protein